MRVIPIVNGQKVCSACKVLLPLAEFYERANHARYSDCKTCSKAKATAHRKTPHGRAMMVARVMKYRQRRPEANKNTKRKVHLKRAFGISIEDYDRRLSEQGGVCAICRKPPAGHLAHLVVDHDHNTEQIRGLLCHRCNLGIGHFRDSVSLLDAAKAYLTA